MGVYAKGACGEFGFEDLVVIWMGNKYIVLLLNLDGKKNNSLIGMYAKSGDMNSAKIFSSLLFLE